MVRRWAAGNSKLQRFAPGVPISRVILVGGATRMPAVGRLIKRVTGVKAELTVDPETAVAEGAAVQAAILDGLPSAGRLAVFNPYHGGRLHQRQRLSNVGGDAEAAIDPLA
jgi:molecular chaperone DnaK (HSP70)